MDEREEGKVAVKLCGQTYMISAHFSMNDMELYFKVLEDEESARNAVTAVIYRKLQECEPPIPTQDALRLENDNAFEPYVKAVIENDETLQDLYDQTDVSLPMIERFALANKLFCKDCTQNIVKALQPTLNVIEQINRSFDFSWIRNIQQITNLYQPVIDRALIQTTRIAQQTAEMFAPIQNTIRQFNDTVANVIANIQVPRYTEEQKKQLEENYKIWGSMGWSVIPHAPLKLFNKAPADIKEADKTALHYFDKNGIGYLFTELREKPIKKEDINSAIFCFENRQYKACTLLLFGIIDAKLIRLQSKKGGRDRRKVGGGAVKLLETKYKEKADTEYFLYHILYFSGLLESLNTFFANGNDFRKEPTVINRNFVDHGMNSRSVRRKDCIQLFLALYNLTELLEDL